LRAFEGRHVRRAAPATRLDCGNDLAPEPTAAEAAATTAEAAATATSATATATLHFHRVTGERRTDAIKAGRIRRGRCRAGSIRSHHDGGDTAANQTHQQCSTIHRVALLVIDGAASDRLMSKSLT